MNAVLKDIALSQVGCELTTTLYRCRECKHRGPAIGRLVLDHAPYGDREVPVWTLQDLECEDCGSPWVDEVVG